MEAGLGAVNYRRVETWRYPRFPVVKYATYCTGTILALLIQARFAEDPRIKKGIQLERQLTPF